MNEDRREEILQLHSEIIHCSLCPLSKTRMNAVPGEGDFNSKILFVGEGPGVEEDLQGRPFVGRAGKILNELLVEIDIDRRSVFITNIVKCRPSTSGRDRRPTNEEIKACSPYLDKQIDMLSPKVICTLGDTATRHFCNRLGIKEGPLSMLHGKKYGVNEKTIFPTYHPAAVLYNPRLKNVLYNDFKTLKTILEITASETKNKLDEFFI